MQSFEDKSGQSWDVELNIGVMERIRGKLDIDLFDPVTEDRQLIAELAPLAPDNIRLFVDMLWLLCEKQANERNMDSACFGEELGSSALQGAYSAFYQEWEAFFQYLGRKDQAIIIAKMNKLIQEGVENVIQEVEKLTFEKLKQATTKSAMNSQE